MPPSPPGRRGHSRAVLATTDDVDSDVLADSLVPYNRWPLNRTKIRGPRGFAGRNSQDDTTPPLLVRRAPAKMTQDLCLGVTAHSHPSGSTVGIYDDPTRAGVWAVRAQAAASSPSSISMSCT